MRPLLMLVRCRKLITRQPLRLGGAREPQSGIHNAARCRGVLCGDVPSLYPASIRLSVSRKYRAQTIENVEKSASRNSPTGWTVVQILASTFLGTFPHSHNLPAGLT